MTRNDLHIFCTALAFTGLILKDEKEENQSERIKDFAKLIEAFCLETTLDTLKETDKKECDPSSIDLIIDCFKAEMRNKEPITPPEDRVSLLILFDRLHQRQQQRRERHFYATGDSEAITNRILQLIEEEIKAEEIGK